MILIHAPHKSIVKNMSGMHIRVDAIDKILYDKERIYFWENSSIIFAPRMKIVDNKCKVFEYNPSNINHLNILYHFINECDFIYCHALLNSYTISYLYDSGKCVTDLHGVAYDELVSEGCISSSQIYMKYEQEIIEKSYKIVSVTEAMAQYYMDKYDVTNDKFIILPVIDCSIKQFIRKDINNNYIYAGDLSTWQNIDKMLIAIKECKSINNHYFIYSNELDKLRNIINQYNLTNIYVDSFSRSELDRIYKQMSFGFILRDDNIINRVACPTKLIEYMQYGIVPIVLSEKIGDFYKLEYKFIKIDDFINNEYSVKSCMEIININYNIYNMLKNIFLSSSEIIKNIKPKNDNFILYNQAEDILMQSVYLYIAFIDNQNKKIYKVYSLNNIIQHIKLNTAYFNKLELYIPGIYYMDNIVINDKVIGKKRKLTYNVSGIDYIELTFNVNKKQFMFEWVSIKSISIYYKFCKIIYMIKNIKYMYKTLCDSIKNMICKNLK